METLSISEWKDEARSVMFSWFRTFPTNKEFTGETIRKVVTDAIGEPYHVNCWGGLISSLVSPLIKRNAVIRVGVSRAVNPTSNSRNIIVYKKVRQ